MDIQDRSRIITLFLGQITMRERDHSIPIPEFGTQPEHLQAVLSLVEEVGEHNITYTRTGIMRRLLGLAPGEYDSSQGESYGEIVRAWVLDPNRPSLPMQQKTEREILGITHAETLAGTGLRLGPIRPKEGMESRAYGYEEIGSVHLVPADGYTFTQFLNNVASKPVTDQVREAIQDIIRDSFMELADDLLERDELGQASETVSYALPIAATLERMESDDKPLLETLRQCSEHAKTGSVREWMLANRIFFFDVVDEAEQIGPSYWHRRLSPEDMRSAWSVIIDLLVQTGGNPRAQDFYAEILKGAWEHVNFSENDWHRQSDTANTEADKTTHDGYELLFREIRDILMQFGDETPA